jgi:hypothetical protein
VGSNPAGRTNVDKGFRSELWWFIRKKYESR